MSLVSSTIPNLINGVSQQPYILRLSSQGEIQENGHATVAEGLKKRPPSVHIAKLFDVPLQDAFIHVINRDEFEQYVVTIINGDLKVHGVDGTPYTVNFPDGKNYLITPEASTSFRAVTVADYTFLLNNKITVLEGNTYSPSRPNEALVAIKQGNYGKTYKIIINGTQAAAYTTPIGDNANQSPYIDTTYIATQLANNFNSTGMTCTRYGTVLYIVGADDFSISVEDGFNGNATVCIKGKAQRFSDLPNNAPDGFTIEVVGDPSSSFDNYFVKFKKNKAADSVGVWQETIKPGIKIDLDNYTMPHVLVRNANGTFTFKRAAWKNKVAGDQDSSPYPSFVGYKLSDMFFYRNRLGLLSEENVVFSEAGEFFNFFPTTVTTILDSDPIDIAVSHVKVSVLRHAVPFNQELMLFSAQTQFTLDAGELLTPKSVSINQTTEFECSVKARPVGAGRNVFFCVNKGAYTGVREYYVDGQTDTNDAADVTAHVPRYIPGQPLKLAAATNEDMIALLADGDRRSLYIYKYYWSGDEKLQSSWSRWVFGEQDRVLSVEFIETKLFIVVARPDGTYLERINIELGATDGMNTPYRVMLDRKCVLTGGQTVLINGTTYTKVPVPYAVASDDFVAFVNEGPMAGEILQIIRHHEWLMVQGDVSGKQLVVGQKYAFKYRFSTITVKEDATGGGTQAVVTGRLQLRRMSMSYERTGFFKVSVTTDGRKPFVYKFTGKVAGDFDNILGQPVLATGVFRFPVMAKNTEVTVDVENDSPMPNTLLNATWDGYFVNHTRRI